MDEDEPRKSTRGTLREISEEDALVDYDAMFKVVMLCSGDVEWDDSHTYSGWYDCKLTTKGKERLSKAQNSLKTDNYTFDLAFSSILTCAVETLSIILNGLELQDIETIASWELNDRHCGSLTGYSQDELVSKYGAEQVNFWINSYYDAPPPITKNHKYYDFIYENPLLPKDEDYPLTESIEMIQKRVINFWKKQICPHVLSGRKILIVTHNACLQALVQYLDEIDYFDLKDIDIPKSVPFYYKLDETLRPVFKDSYLDLSLSDK